MSSIVKLLDSHMCTPRKLVELRDWWRGGILMVVARL
jgi:hypothetical protein